MPHQIGAHLRLAYWLPWATDKLYSPRMERIEFLYRWDGFLITAGLFAVLVAVAECSFRIGSRRIKQGIKVKPDSQDQAIEAAMLSLLGLLLAFTFSMSASRFEARKQVVLQDANAIGTTFLRTQLLSTAGQTIQAQGLMRSYVATRLQIYAAPAGSPAQKAAAVQMQALQHDLWDLVATDSRQHPNAVSTALLLTSLNEMIDLSETQVTIFANHVPEDILLLLLIMSTITVAMVAFLNGKGGKHQRLFTIILAATIALTIFIVLDLDRPQRGLIRVGVGSVERAQAMIESKR